MRFCLVSTQPDWGGGEKLLWSIRCALAKQGHAVNWIVRRDSPLQERVISAGDQLLTTTRRRGFHPADWFQVRKQLAAAHNDVLILNDSHAIMLGGSAALTLGINRPMRLAIRHTIFPLHSPFKLRRMSDFVVCVSQAAVDVVRQAGIPAERSAVVYGGCDPIDSDPLARQWAATEFEAPVHQSLIVCVGNLLHCKGHMELIEAAAILRKRDPEFRVLIAGEGPLRPQMATRISELSLEKHVVMLGFRTDADRLLDAADVVVHPSHQEGLSLVMIQAQLLKKRIVSTGVGGTAEVLGLDEPGPKPFWIAKPEDAQDLANQLASAISHGRTSATKEFLESLEMGAERARNKFNIDHNVKQLVDLVEIWRAKTRKTSA